MIITNNEEALRVVCSDVLPDEVNDIIERLESELNHANFLGQNGVGLAAPQIGIAKKAAIVRVGNNNINLINCNISQGWDPAVFEGEGCLSFPGRVEKTTRFQEALIENNLVMPNRMIITGFLAVACQHEIDHYNQKLFTDHIFKDRIKKLKPNDICGCGRLNEKTGMPFKYKKCCGKKI